MFPPEAFRPLLLQISELLRKRNIRFALTGGLVSAFFREPRYTQDADLVVSPDDLRAELPELLADLRQANYLFREEVVRDALKRGRSFQVIQLDEMLKLDFYPYELIPGELSRAQPDELFPGVVLPILSPPDVVASKIVWISKGSHKSRSDVRQMMRRMSPEQHADVRSYLLEFGLVDLLDEVLAEPDEIDM